MALLAEQRMDRILEELSRREAVSVAQLCQIIGVSEATIRRDLTALSQRGKLAKVHGGALPVRETFRAEEPDMETKRQLHTPEKRRIAQYAAGLIQNNDVVFLGTNGIAPGQGFTTPDPEEAMVKALAAARSREAWALADSSKFDTVTAATAFPLEKAGIITERLPDQRYLDDTVVKEV